MSEHDFSQYCSLEEIDAEGKFVLATPNYELLQSLQDVPSRHLPMTTISIGDTGAGKSTLLGACQPLAAQTCLPYHGYESASDQHRSHITTLGTSLDTQGLNDGFVCNRSQTETDEQKIIKTYRMLLDRHIQHLHTIFIHLKFDDSGRVSKPMLHAFQHAIQMADLGKLNAVIVTRFFEQPNFGSLATAFKNKAGQVNFTLPDKIFVVNLTLRNVRNDLPHRSVNLARALEEGIAEFDYTNGRVQLQTFLLGVTTSFRSSPMEVKRRNEFCRRGCGMEGDSRTFGRICHKDLVPGHPPGFSYEPENLRHVHSGNAGASEHYDFTTDYKGEFSAGGFAMLGAKLPTAVAKTQTIGGVATQASDWVLPKPSTIGALAAAQRKHLKVNNSANRLLLARKSSISDLATEFGQHAQVLFTDGSRTASECIEKAAKHSEKLTSMTAEQLASMGEQVVAQVTGPATLMDNIKGGSAKMLSAIQPITKVITGMSLASEGIGHMGYGRWSCCNAIEHNAAGCAKKWSCCGRWEAVDAKARDSVGCGKLRCKQCDGLWEEIPPPSSAEMRCGDSDCGHYVGRVPPGITIVPKEGCRELHEHENHDIAVRTENTADGPVDAEVVRALRSVGLGTAGA